MKNKYLTFLIVLSMLAVIYNLLPLYSKYNPARSKLDYSLDMYSSMMNNFQIEDSIRLKRMEYLNKINELDFRTRLSQEEIISVLYSCALKNNIYISNIRFIEEDNVLDRDIDIVESNDASVFQTMGVALEIKAELEKILGFIDDIEGYRDISVPNLNVSAWEEDIVFAFVQMKFYAVPVDILL